MPVVIAAIAVAGSLCLLDLLVAFGVIWSRREHSDLPPERQPDAAPPVTGLTAGQRPLPFAVVTVDGMVATASAGLRLAAFFSATCTVCPGLVAPFVEYVRANRFDSDDVLVTVLAARDAVMPAYLGELARVALVTIQPDGNPVAGAFGVTGYPAFFLLGADGAVVASSFDPAALPVPAMV
jgi:hypothetical protein